MESSFQFCFLFQSGPHQLLVYADDILTTGQKQ